MQSSVSVKFPSLDKLIAVFEFEDSIVAAGVDVDEDARPNVITVQRPEATLDSIVRFELCVCVGYGIC